MSMLPQEQALLKLVEDDRARRCDLILAAARAQAAELRRLAHQQARERVRAALSEARERARLQLAAATAQWQTRQRLAQQQATTGFLAQALAALPGALLARWQRAESRRRWLAFALQQAAHVLPGAQWRIEHAAGLLPEDILAVGGNAPVGAWQPVPQLSAGLRIHSNGNCVDASLRGLMADRDALAAILLQAREAGA